jgi:hypothetical protein
MPPEPAPLEVEVRSDPDAAPGDLTSVLAGLLLDRARQQAQAKRTDRADNQPAACRCTDTAGSQRSAETR